MKKQVKKPTVSDDPDDPSEEFLPEMDGEYGYDIISEDDLDRERDETKSHMELAKWYGKRHGYTVRKGWIYKAYAGCARFVEILLAAVDTEARPSS
jgi:hypothetical protein